MRELDRAKYCSRVPLGCNQYELPILLFVPTPLILTYYSRLGLRRSTDDQTRMWIVYLTEYVFMSRAMFVVNAEDRACPSYYTWNQRFDNLSDGILFRLLEKILDALRYLGLYKFCSANGK